MLTKKEIVKLNGLKIVGLTTRTKNQSEMYPQTAKIGKLIGFYHANGVADRLIGRVKPGITYSIYTEYESDEHGEYTYCYGEEVGIPDQNSKLSEILIPSGYYQKFTTRKGQMPDIVTELWQEIWKMDEKELGGKRTYLADFEIYDERASDLKNAEVDIYIGIDSKE